jgi:hypothetical protein
MKMPLDFGELSRAAASHLFIRETKDAKPQAAGKGICLNE